MESGPRFSWAVLAFVSPLVGVHGLPYFLMDDRRGGLVRLVAGLALLLSVVGFYSGWFGNPLILVLTAPMLVLPALALAVVGYLWLWVQGVGHVLRRLPQP